MYAFLAQLFSFVASPLTYIFILIGVALVFYKQKKVRVAALIAAGVLFLFFSNGFIYYTVKRSITKKYTENIDTSRQYKYGVILGSGVPNDTIRNRSELDNRIVAAVLLYKKGIVEKVVYSGALDAERNATYEKLFRESMMMFGVADEDFILEPLARNTKEHPLMLKELIGLNDSEFVIITSALHMRRALKIFEGEGLSPKYYSTDINTSGYTWRWQSFFPNFSLLDKWAEILHEQIGLMVN